MKYIHEFLLNKNNNIKISDKKYTLAIINAKLDYKKLEFQFFFKTELLLTNYSIGSGGRIVNYGKDKLLFTIGHLDLKDKIQSEENLAGKIISIKKAIKVMRFYP